MIRQFRPPFATNSLDGDFNGLHLSWFSFLRDRGIYCELRNPNMRLTTMAPTMCRAYYTTYYVLRYWLAQAQLVAVDAVQWHPIHLVSGQAQHRSQTRV